MLLSAGPSLSPHYMQTAGLQLADQVPVGRCKCSRTAALPQRRRSLGSRGGHAQPALMTAAVDQALTLSFCLCADCYSLQRAVNAEAAVQGNLQCGPELKPSIAECRLATQGRAS